MSTHRPDLLRDEGIGFYVVLLLRPTPESTEVSKASSHQDIRVLLKRGLPLVEVLIPRTRPADAAQLSLFGESLK